MSTASIHDVRVDHGDCVYAWWLCLGLYTATALTVSIHCHGCV